MCVCGGGGVVCPVFIRRRVIRRAGGYHSQKNYQSPV